MLKRKNINNKSLIELAISESNSLSESDKKSLRNWLDGMVNFVNKAVDSRDKRNKTYSGRVS